MLTTAADERAALQFDDVASALDAGLPIAALQGDAAQGERTLHGVLQRRGIRLSATEDAVLLAAWRAGRAGASLRSCAEARRRRAEFQRATWASLRYPLLLIAVTFLATLTTAPVIGHWWFPVLVGGGALSAVGLVVWCRWSLHHGGNRLTHAPVLGPLLTQLAELPYLEILHALYGAGVPLRSAHSAAVAAVGFAPVHQRLGIADRVLQAGQSLAEGLDTALALHPETRTLLSNGERAGQLEEALGRALARRRDVTTREITRTGRIAGAIIYGVAVAVACLIIFQFYSRYFGMLRSR